MTLHCSEIALKSFLTVALLVAAVNRFERTPVSANSKSHVMPKALLFSLLALSALLLVVAIDSGELEDNGRNEVALLESKRPTGRFLLQRNNPRGYYWWNECYSDNRCRRLYPGPEYRDIRCCWNTRNSLLCIDVGGEDRFNCGRCAQACNWPRSCCGGVCVNLNSNRNNCGRCGNMCGRGDRCIRGMCNYN